LKVVPPKGGQPVPVAASLAATGAELKGLLAEIAESEPEMLHLAYQNGTRNSAKIPLDDARTLAEQGVEPDATISVRVNQAFVTAADSALRQSIAKSGGTSYYYAHANEKALPKEHRYAYGGAPARLDGEEGAAPEKLEAPSLARPITQYSWGDEGDFVCIYVSADGEAAAIEAAGDGKDGQVRVEFGVKAVELRIKGSPQDFALVLKGLENEIVPEESKHRVSAGKRVTLKLKKRRPVAWTRLVKPS